jgi:hypothetical protein
MKMGVTTKAETSGLVGFVNGCIYGVLNPVGGVVESVKLMINGYGLQEKAAELDAIYVPRRNAYTQEYENAKSTGTAALILILVSGWAGLAYMVKKPSLSSSSSNSQRFRQADKRVVVDVEPGIIVCCRCGTKNRHRSHTVGQNLVCGNCKTSLTS